ncbi:MAG: hypothetical protein M5U28_18680 [Sandaracinaceae bacterium]|nr:hypothetical protein [Sandaracinaceae bacterium]
MDAQLRDADQRNERGITPTRRIRTTAANPTANVYAEVISVSPTSTSTAILHGRGGGAIASARSRPTSSSVATRLTRTSKAVTVPILASITPPAPTRGSAGATSPSRTWCHMLLRSRESNMRYVLLFALVSTVLAACATDDVGTARAALRG